MDRCPGAVCGDLVENVRKLNLVLLAGDVTNSLRTDDVGHPEERMVRVEEGLFLIDVDSGNPRPSRPQSVN